MLGGGCGTVVLSASTFLRRVSAEEVYSPLNVYDTINGDGVYLSDNYVLSIDYLCLYLSMYIIIHCQDKEG